MILLMVLGCGAPEPLDPEPPVHADPPSAPVRELREPIPNPPVDVDALSDKGRLKLAIRSQMGEMKACYEQRLASNPSLAGRVALGWTLAGGSAQGVYVVSNDTGDHELPRCMVEQLKRWTFEPALEGDVTWPFVFKPADRTDAGDAPG